MRILTILIIFIGSIQLGIGQNEEVIIKLSNPSFEDIRRNSHVPTGWFDCGFITETPPDVQPGWFGVEKKPKTGMSYLGLVVRDNETWEAVAQELSQPLINGNCYSFNISMCRSELYLSPSKSSSVETNYSTPVKLKIWGGNEYCKKSVLLGESILVKNYRWVDYTFKLEANGDEAQYTHIILEAYYKTPTLFPYNGNLLLDNASDLKLIPCDEQAVEDVVAINAEPNPQEFIQEDNSKDESVNPEPKDEKIAPNNGNPSTPNKSETSLAGIKKSDLKKGQIIRMDKLFFEADKADIKTSSNEVLNEVYQFLAIHTDVSVEIGGHTNDTPPHWYCDSLSTARAKAVADYLNTQGIKRQRLQFKGYGKRKPLFSNRTEYGRKRNQRVEIKVLEIESPSDNN